MSSLRISVVPPNSNFPDPSAAALWVSFVDRVLVAVPVSQIVPSSAVGSTDGGRDIGAGRLPAHSRWTLEPFPPQPMHHYGLGEPPLHDAAVCLGAKVSILDSIKSDSSARVTLLACGAAPFPLTCYQLGGSPPNEPRALGKFARALQASAVNFVSGWLGGASPRETDHPAQEVVSLSQESGFRDDRRNISNVWVDPTRSFALASDQLGRVLLIDAAQKLVVRIWKGVREAQCGWINVATQLFAVLYSPRRGFIEIYAAVHGPKVRTITVGTKARLVYASSLESPPRGLCCVIRSPPEEGGAAEILEVVA